ncbi:MAG TPA: hypothetical protein VK812_13570 [Candidatus Binatus sp.]|nr:hypothetical protein [Candidatus Binatus sp.]
MMISNLIFSTLILHAPDSRGLVLYCILGFGAGVGLFIYGFRLLQRRRLILDTPFSKIRSASMGMVEISGQAVGPYTMVAPITARPCYYYRTLVWEYKQSGKNKTWVKIAGECMHLPFFIDDNTGRLLVDPRGADLDLHCDFKQEFCDSFFTTKEPAPANVHSFLSRHGIVTSNKIKVEEYCIKPKNSLFLLGTLGENPGIEVGPQPVQDAEGTSFSSGRFSLSSNLFSFSLGMGSRDADLDTSSSSHVFTMPSEAGTEVIRLSPESTSAKSSDMSQQQKVSAALLKAGIASPVAWAAAGVRSAAMATPGGVLVMPDPANAASAGNGDGTPGNTEGTQSVNGFDPHPPVALMKGTNNKTFLISWRSQQEVARSLGWKCILMIWGGPALALLSLYFFLGIKNLF